MHGPLPPADAARQLAREFAETADEYDRTGAFPFANFQRLAQHGLLGLTVDQRSGGRGAGLADAVEVVRAIASGEPSTALVLAQYYTTHATIAGRNWPARIVEQLGREAANGVSLINALRVEPELGTPARGGLPATVARRTADGWSLSGHKIFSTGIPILSWLVVWARTDELAPRVGSFLVPASTPGIHVEETWQQLGMRATASHDVILDDVVIPLENAVDIHPADAPPPANAAAVAWTTTLTGGVYDGIARAARDWFITFARTRVPANLGATLASLPRFQEAVGEIERLRGINDRLLRGAAAETDAGRPPSLSDSGLLKLTVTSNAIEAVETAVRLTGNPGLATRNPLQRHYRDVLCGRIHTPQDDSARLAAGRAALRS